MLPVKRFCSYTFHRPYIVVSILIMREARMQIIFIDIEGNYRGISSR